MTPKEALIRDKLAQNLEVLAPGLELIDMEFLLRNPVGAKGFIDLLAKYRFGDRGIIELKRSNQAARQAMHELLKYAALFRRKEGLPCGKIRCFVVSTEWHELAVPFAEFLRSAESQCEGFLITVDQEGRVLTATKQDPVELAQPITLFREHSILLYSSQTERDNAIRPLSDTLSSEGGEAGFILTQNYEGPSESVICGYSIYLVPIRVAESTTKAIHDQLQAEYGDELEDVRISFEKQFQFQVVERFGYGRTKFDMTKMQEQPSK